MQLPHGVELFIIRLRVTWRDALWWLRETRPLYRLWRQRLHRHTHHHDSDGSE